LVSCPVLSQLVRDRRERNRHLTDRALADFRAWQQTL
jgi:folate-dependent tRNA-U54 methylase TrmFO/GidA